LSEQSDSAVDNRLFDEWKESRDLISKLDDILSDLRKYGFTFITALLAADSILGQASSSATLEISPQVKLATFASTLILVAGLYATDGFYRVVQKGAVERAKEIEDHFKRTISLTHKISQYYGMMHLWLYVEALYVFFALATEVLGLIVLYPSNSLMALITVATAMTLLFIYFLSRVGKPPNFRHFRKSERQMPT